MNRTDKDNALIQVAEVIGYRLSAIQKWGFGYRLVFRKGAVGDLEIKVVARSRLQNFVSDLIKHTKL